MTFFAEDVPPARVESYISSSRVSKCIYIMFSLYNVCDNSLKSGGVRIKRKDTEVEIRLHTGGSMGGVSENSPIHGSP